MFYKVPHHCFNSTPQIPEVQTCVSLSGFLCLWCWGPNSGPPAGTVSALSHWDLAFCSKIVWCYQHIGRERSLFKTGVPGGRFRRYYRGLMLRPQEKVKTTASQAALSGAGALQGWGFPNRISPFMWGSRVFIHPSSSEDTEGRLHLGSRKHSPSVSTEESQPTEQWEVSFYCL